MDEAENKHNKTQKNLNGLFLLHFFVSCFVYFLLHSFFMIIFDEIYLLTINLIKIITIITIIILE